MVDFKPKQFLYPFAILSFKKHLKQCSQITRSDLVDLQNRELRSLIVYSAKHVPFYRRFFAESGVNPQEIRSESDLRKLPIVTKSMIRECETDFISDICKNYDAHITSTSGSTGNAFRFYVGKDSKSAIFALLWNAWEENGYRPYDRWMNLKGYEFPDGARWKYSISTNCIGVPCCAITDEIAEEICKKMETFRPKHIMGYGSLIYDFCVRIADSKRLKNLGVQQVSTSSEMLYDFQRQTIQDSFGCKASSIYHQVEQVCFIFECRYQLKHLAQEYGILELVDEQNKPVEVGSVGSAVCTGFYNRSMPFIRYKLDDRIKLSRSTHVCKCGRSHQVVESIEGRGSDAVVSRSGRKYNHMDVAFHNVIGLSGMQIVQNDLTHLSVRLVRNSFWRDYMESDIVASIKKYTQAEFEIDVQYVTELKKNGNGKQRLVLSDLVGGCDKVGI